MRKKDIPLYERGERTYPYEVFAREFHDQPLQHVGTIQAPNIELAKVRAWHMYDEKQWIEMCLFPTSAIVPITEEDKKIKIKAV